MHALRFAVVPALLASFAGQALAARQAHPDPQKLLTEQRQAMKKLDAMDGVWRGKGWMILPSGDKQEFTQTERVGPMIDGALKVIEGRAYGESGEVTFNAFAVISYDPAKQAYSMRSYARGNVGDFTVKPTDDGFTWEIPAGPATIRYAATVKDGVWHETGERVVADGEPVRFLEMKLERVGDTDWPAGGAIGPRE